ncbi:MAG TPA: glycoside hydrolase family 2 TIM barrel-domain containing protein [Candidatus Limnocylindrales bacterium]
MRPALSLDGTWEFVPDPRRRLAPARLPEGGPIAVPGAWEGQVEPGYGIVHGWYRRRFSIPAEWPPGRLVLRFDGVMNDAVVWLDGRPVGRNEDPVPFSVEAGPAIPGVEHELVVSVANPINVISAYPAFDGNLDTAVAAAELLDGRRIDEIPHGKQTWYTSTSGILGSVRAEVAPDLHFADLSVEPDLDRRRAVVRWRLVDTDRVGARVDIALLDPGGRVVAERSVDASDGTATLPIARPERWGLWQPALYRLSARLRPAVSTDADESMRADEVSLRFGMRTIEVRDGHIYLNGSQLYVRGALDQDFWPVGRSNPPSRAAIEEQVALARGMGLNLLRCHIKVPSSDYLDVADEAGLPLWCELPSWDRFSVDAGRRARDLLGRTVDVHGNHPSIVVWTVVNEDWGTDIRNSARDRRWLRQTADWLKERDPSRLVVDNSACATAHGPNFHLRTDLLDFHAYRSVPDGLPRWRAFVDDLARRPSWLWSPFGDASPRGDEPVVLSEFGGWGLPRPSAVRPGAEPEPWWWSTGPQFRRPNGTEERFRAQRLDRVWPDVDALAEATQWQQFEGLVSQIRELRRVGSIQGYVITELADAFWEANGLLDVGRRRKVFHSRLAEINAADVLIVDLPRTDVWAGERLVCQVILASHPDPRRGGGRRASGERSRAPDGGRIEWHLSLASGERTSGVASIRRWPHWNVESVGEVEVVVPDADSIREAELIATATGPSGRRAVYRQRCLVVPRPRSRPHRVAVVDPLDLWELRSRVQALGHEIVESDHADVIVAALADAQLVDLVGRGKHLLVLARHTDALAAATGLARPASIEPRRIGDDDAPARRPWDGDWVSVFAWALPGIAPGLPGGGLLNDAHAEAYPDHVVTGLDVADPASGVGVGMFSGWVDCPAAILASFEQGHGRVTLTTLRLSPEDGPVATAFLESLLQGGSGPPTGAAK